MIDNDDDDGDDMIIIAVFLGCVIFDLRSGGPSSLFRVPPTKKNKTPDHSIFFRCGYMAALFFIHHW